MKFNSLLLISLLIPFSTFTASRLKTDKQTKQQQQQVVYVPVPAEQTAVNPIERDKEIDNQLFLHFLYILGNFGKVLLDPHNLQNVALHVGGMIDGFISVAQTVMKTPKNHRPIMVSRLGLLVIKYLNDHGVGNQR